MRKNNVYKWFSSIKSSLMSVDGQPHFFHPQALKIDQISNNA